MKLINTEKINSTFLNDFPYRVTEAYKLLSDNGNTIGVGILGHNKYHPVNHYGKIIIKPEYRNQGFGKNFISRLNKRMNKPFQYATSESNIEQINFLTSCGFQLARKCWEYEVPYNDIQAKNILSFNTFENCPNEIMKRLYNLIYEDYRINHLNVGPLNEKIKKTEWVDIMLKHMDPELSTYYFDGKNLLYMIVEKEKQITFVSYVGGQGNKELKQDYYQSVLYDLKNKFATIHFEIDSTDNNALLLKEFITIKKTVSYDTYLL